MFAQIYALQFDPSQAESHVKFAEQVVTPDLQQQPGFQGMQFLVDRQSGRAMGISYSDFAVPGRAAAERAGSRDLRPQNRDT